MWLREVQTRHGLEDPSQVTDDMIAATFGPQWKKIVSIADRADAATVAELEQLAATWGAANTIYCVDPSCHSSRHTARQAVRKAAWAANRKPMWEAVHSAVGGFDLIAHWDVDFQTTSRPAREAFWCAAEAFLVADLVEAEHVAELTAAFTALFDNTTAT